MKLKTILNISAPVAVLFVALLAFGAFGCAGDGDGAAGDGGDGVAADGVAAAGAAADGVAAGAAAGAADGAADQAVAPATGKLVVLSSRDEKFMTPLWDLVRSKHPDLELVVDYGKDAGYLDRMAAEKDSPRADLFLSKGSAAMESAVASGLLAALPEAALNRVPDHFRGASGQWVGLSARARVIVARRDLADPPARILDLADKRYAGRVARTVATNSSFVGGVTTVLADQGEEGAKSFLAGLASNTADGKNVYPKHTPAVAAVAQGQADVALVNHYYFYRSVFGKEADPSLDAAAAQAKLDAAPIVAIYPADKSGVAWNVSGGGLVAGGPNPAAARAVLEILLSDEGQQAYAWTNREYPVVAGVQPPPGVRPATEFTWSATPLAKLAELQPKAVELIQAAGLR